MLKYLVAAILVLALVVEGADNVKKKVTIEQLQERIDTLEDHVETIHQWANTTQETLEIVVDNTNNLNRRLKAVESRGPVAKNQEYK